MNIGELYTLACKEANEKQDRAARFTEPATRVCKVCNAAPTRNEQSKYCEPCFNSYMDSLIAPACKTYPLPKKGWGVHR